MSGIIAFSEEPFPASVLRGWLFRGLLEAVKTACSDDHSLVSILNQAEATGYLFLNSIENDELRTKLRRVLTAVIKGTINGTAESKILNGIKDEGTKEGYRDCLRKLLETAGPAEIS